MPAPQKRILILCKTYPSPSAKYAETSCVAGMEANGRLIRLYPVPFRLISSDRQFKKWQWVTARVQKSPNDRRPESYKLFVDTVNCDPRPLSTTNNWYERRRALAKLSCFGDFQEIEDRRQLTEETLAIVRPARIVGLDIAPASSPDWTEEERAKLLRMQQQGNLFEKTEAASFRQLRKVPFDFHYRYECDTPAGSMAYRHKIVDWEIGALFWNLRRAHGQKWEEPFRAKLESELPQHDLMFLMGTIHRFPDQWLIVSLIYPPKRQPDEIHQQSLFPT